MFLSLVEIVRVKYDLTYKEISIGLKKEETFITVLRSKKSITHVPDTVAELLRLKYPFNEEKKIAKENNVGIVSDTEVIYRTKKTEIASYVEQIEELLEKIKKLNDSKVKKIS